MSNTTKVKVNPGREPDPNWIQGDYQKDQFLGVREADGFLSSNTLIRAFSLNEQFCLEPEVNWLNYQLDGIGELLIAQKPIMHSVSYHELNERGLVDGSATINVNNETFKVRLLKGMNRNLTPFKLPDFKGCPCQWVSNYNFHSEWERTLVRSHFDTSTTLQGEKFIKLSNKDMCTWHEWSLGTHNWCQETPEHESNEENKEKVSKEERKEMRLIRGGKWVYHYYWYNQHEKTDQLGWRPVLERINYS